MAVLLLTATIFRELPNSCVQEIEADQVGLTIAVEAFFDPHASKRVFLAMMIEEITDLEIFFSISIKTIDGTYYT